ncbi:MAG: helix-turn-helix transcriptional regulator [Gammaproteobacteria bacterium]|nr:helix-turn-helix transcriptional regulator [Gammaproteobacteria bacterium]
MYVLGQQFQGVVLSAREAECMLELLRGKEIENVAEELALSKHSVVFYIRNMLRKLNCKTKEELVALILQSDFLKNLDRDLPDMPC